MKQLHLLIQDIPAILWGESSEKLFIAVHGDQSHKADEALVIFAEEAAGKGCQTLSFDLPEHGDRKMEPRRCDPLNCIADLQRILAYARKGWSHIGLFGCSMGAYFSMLAYRGESISQSLFLSPVVNMKRIIDNMMMWFGISEAQLEQDGEIQTPVKPLYWDYYQYVVSHPVSWKAPTALLYGKQDNLCAYEDVDSFAKKFGAEMTVMEDGEHFFHTDAQLVFLRQWLKSHIHLD